MAYDLIIAEKPSAARKIAAALADGPVKDVKVGQVSYHQLKRKGKDIVIVAAVGHLFGLAQKEKNWIYPVYDIEWKPNYETNKEADYTKKYIDVIRKVAKDANEFTIATDLDVEGETIAFNILRFLCGQQDANRMKFSTLTKPELQQAYDKKLGHLFHGLAEAGVTRHTLDWIWGINFSRALTLAVKAAGRYKVLSIGRVQGPALNFLAQREREIAAFIPTPFWQLEADHGDFTSMYENDKIEKKEDADKVFRETKDAKKAKVSKVDRKQYNHNPPTPFNLTDLQKEAFGVMGISPKETQEIAQVLYENAYISYPRTSSQKLPAALGLRVILDKLAQQAKYAPLVEQIVDNAGKPNEGDKIDDAHPAIHPTGEKPVEGRLTAKQAKVYDLIVKRFLSCFGKPAIRESLKVGLDINGHVFLAEGKTTKERNWYDLYEPYVKLKDVQLPDLKEGQEVHVNKVDLLSKETQPPSRYNEASIISELEKRNLGTKATRAEIIDTLYRRGYLEAKRIEVTPLGLQVISTLEKFCPEIVSEDLTRRFEEEMEGIEKGQYKGEKTIEEAKTELNKIFMTFKSKEKDIGMSLLGSIQETQQQANTLGPCPTCKVGILMMRRSKFGQFVGCNKYPECKQTYPLPRDGLIQKTEEVCDKCGTPFVKVIRRGKKPWMMCLAMDCPTKAEWNAKREAWKAEQAKKISEKDAAKLGGTEVTAKPAKEKKAPKKRVTKKKAEE